MTTTTQPRAQYRSTTHRRPTGTYQARIEGRYRPIPTWRLALYWFLYRAGRLTRRQLRVALALEELAERRRYTGPEKEGRAHYTIEEVKSLVGGRSSATAHAELIADVKHLGRIGLARMTPRAVTFAGSVEALELGDEGLALAAGFLAFLEQIPNRRRKVPVPRRTLRALAAGFGRAETGYIFAALMCSVFWKGAEQGFRVDGRMKLSWIEEVFGLSRRAVTGARAHLMALGWIEPQDPPQWQLNQWGVHDVIRVDLDLAGAKRSTESGDSPEDGSVENPEIRAAGEGRGPGGFASPTAKSAGEFATPRSNSSPFSSRKKNNKRLGEPAPSDSGSREKRPLWDGREAISIRNVRTEDLDDTPTLLLLYRQAVLLGLAQEGEAGQHLFLAFAHRARTRGKKPGALLTWLLRNRKVEFLTDVDEDAARRRLRDHRAVFSKDREETPPVDVADAFVQRCVLMSRPHRIDPFELARRISGWTRDRWDEAYQAYQDRQSWRQGWSSASGAFRC